MAILLLDNWTNMSRKWKQAVGGCAAFLGPVFFLTSSCCRNPLLLFFCPVIWIYQLKGIRCEETTRPQRCESEFSECVKVLCELLTQTGRGNTPTQRRSHPWASHHTLGSLLQLRTSVYTNTSWKSEARRSTSWSVYVCFELSIISYVGSLSVNLLSLQERS